MSVVSEMVGHSLTLLNVNLDARAEEKVKRMKLSYFCLCEVGTSEQQYAVLF